MPTRTTLIRTTLDSVVEKQHAIGSGFTAAATADEVLADIDLSGTNVVVTGGHSGLGLEVTRAPSKAGAAVTVGARDPDHAAGTLSGLERVDVDRLDLLDPASVAAFAARYLSSGRALHILVNNASTHMLERKLDPRGYEVTFATNHLGHFQLTLGLTSALRAAHGARVVNVSSGTHRLCGIRWDDPHFTAGYDVHLAYAQSKTALILFAVELDHRWAGVGIRGYAVHPGIAVATLLPDLSRGPFTMEQLRLIELIDDVGRPIIDPEREKKTPQQAAATTVFAGTSPLLADIGGVYLKNCDVSRIDDTTANSVLGAEPVVTTDVASHAVDPTAARWLWKLSEQLLSSHHPTLLTTRTREGK